MYESADRKIKKAKILTKFGHFGIFKITLRSLHVMTARISNIDKKIHAVKNNSKKSTFSKIFYKSRNYGDFWLVTSILASF